MNSSTEGSTGFGSARRGRRAGERLASCSGLARATAPRGLERLEDRRVLAVDLNLSAITTLNAVVTPGNEFSGAFIIENDGDQATPAFRVEFRLSRDTTFGDADDILLGFRHVTAPIAPGGQTTLDEDFDLPRNVLTGNYFLAAFVDSLGQVAESDETNNLRFTSIAQVIAANSAGQVDIDLDVVGVGATAGTYDAGDSFPGVATYRNTGTAASGAYTTVWFLSTNQIFGDSDDIELAVANSPGGLPGQTQFADAFTLEIPIDTPSGSYFFGVFVDARFDINEPLEEDNNIDFTATPAVVVEGVPLVPDLQALQAITGQASYDAGEEISFSATIRNAGNAPSGAFEITYTLTIDTTIGDGDDVVLVFKDVVASLGAGENRTDTRVVNIPAGTVPGEYFLSVSLDPDNDLEESNENNNTDLTDTRLVTVQEPPPDEPDIVVLGGGGLDREIQHLAKAIRSNGTLFGQIDRDGETKTNTFKIRNEGIRDLVITNIVVSGREPGDYEVILEPSATIAPGESSNFQVRFDPTQYLVRRAKVVIFTNDPDRPRFDMKVRGRGMPPDSATDIDVQGRGKSIADNDNTPQKNTGTKFGRVALGGMSERVYTIRNVGEATLTLDGPILLSGAGADQFTITVQPALSVLEAGQSTTFTVVFNPTLTGAQRADILIPNNDPDEPVFNFRVIGSGA